VYVEAEAADRFSLNPFVEEDCGKMYDFATRDEQVPSRCAS
jgi:hypothetical protein